MNQHTADRVAAIGDERIRVHRSLRLDLADLRNIMAEAADPDARSISAESDRAEFIRAQPLRDLPQHCLAFCAAVTVHHTDEDASLFPELAVELPELAGVLDEIAHDHVLIAGILRRVRELAENLDRDKLPRARDEIDGLAAILESHFRWEERRIIGARTPR